MIITDITRQKKNQNRFSIYIDGKFAFGLEDIDVAEYKLKIGQEISEDKYNLIMDKKIYEKARDKAVRLISFKERTEKEIRDKLLQEEYPQNSIDKVIEVLKKYNYLDDERYTISFIKDRFRLKGFGKKRIEFELKMKGIKSEVIDYAFQELNLNDELDEDLKAIELLRKKLKGQTEVDFKEKQKLFGFLARRGYSYEIINNAFKTVLQEDLEC